MSLFPAMKNLGLAAPQVTGKGTFKMKEAAPLSIDSKVGECVQFSYENEIVEGTVYQKDVKFPVGSYISINNQLIRVN